MKLKSVDRLQLVQWMLCALLDAKDRQITIDDMIGVLHEEKCKLSQKSERDSVIESGRY